MTGRTHDLAAFTALGVVFMAAPPSQISLGTVLVALLANQIGGIIPDIDQPTAPFWRNLPIGGVFGKIISKGMGGHRFITHSIVGLVCFGFLSQALLRILHPIMPHINITIVWWAFMIGMFSHLVMDSFTKEGVPWLLPLPIKFGFPPIRRLRVTSGKSIELLVLFPALIVANIILYSRHYAFVMHFLHTQIH